VGLAELFQEALLDITTPADRRQLRLFLLALDHWLVNGVLSGHWRSFRSLAHSDQVQVLLSWMQSRIALRRAAFQAVKRLALFLFYSWHPEDGPNPTWHAIGYQHPEEVRDSSTVKIKPMNLSREEELSTEVLIIGSGAGGSVVAAELALAGHEVLVVEKGGNESPVEVGGLELEGNAALFERRGALTTSDLGVVVLAGSTLGGGTVVNWSTSLRTPDYVRHEWAREFGFEGVDGSAYDRCLVSVEETLHIDTAESQPNGQNQVLERGGRALGFSVDTIPRNVDHCVDCSYCAFGCRYGAKQSTRRNYLVAAQRAGARLLVRTEADRLIIQRGRVVGADLTVRAGSIPQRLRVRAEAVVVSAGSIHTPALLARSGVRHPQLGHNLHLHPVTAPVGLFDEPIQSWQGPPQTRMIEDLSNPEGTGYGVRLEVAPAHPGLWASALPWSSGREHKQLMSQVDHMANIIVLARDRGSGRVRVDREGRPILEYGVDRFDAARLMVGTEAELRILRAAGASRLISPHTTPTIFETNRGGDFEGYVAEVCRRPVRANEIGLFSAHQMGSCRIAGSRAQGVVRPDGETWSIRRLYVADASVFPTASGVNPMISIMAVAKLLSTRILDGMNT
jgi:choline dehydrogenase-like flavoprotein